MICSLYALLTDNVAANACSSVNLECIASSIAIKIFQDSFFCFPSFPIMAIFSIREQFTFQSHACQCD